MAENEYEDSSKLKVRIIKGTNQIGGCVTEIESEKARIIIDFGEDLDNNKNEPNNHIEIEGLTYGEPKYDAVFITHSHMDHIGLIDHILPDIPIYIEEKTKMIYELTNGFADKKCNIDTKTILYDEAKKEYQYIYVNDMKIKYYTVDHSAYNSSMVLVECNDKRILHTGDFRNHGYKGKLFFPTLKKIGKIDLLITEGTCFSRENNIVISEEMLKDKAVELFKKYNQVFIMQSSTNIDRITSFFKASLITKKKFIQDAFTANLTLNIGGNIPNPIFDNNKVSVWIPMVYDECKSEQVKEKYLKHLEKYKNNNNLHGDYAMLVKPSMYPDIKMLYDKGYIKKACIVYSMWNGYLKDKKTKCFVNKLKALGMDFEELHTSGHADLDTIKKLEEVLCPNKVIVIHTTKKNYVKEVFKNAVILEDGTSYIVE